MVIFLKFILLEALNKGFKLRPRSSVAEHFLGKEEVAGSIPVGGSK